MRDNIAGATAITLGGSVSAAISHTGDFDFFKVTLTESKTLMVYTSGSTDTVGYLLEGSCTLRQENDNQLDPNFRLTAGLQAGTYYIAVKSASGATGSYTIYASAVSNTSPSITSLPNQTITENTSTEEAAFTVADSESDAGSLSISRSSSDPSLIPIDNIHIDGTDGARTVTVTPAANKYGSATITLTVSDGLATATSSFTVTVNQAVFDYVEVNKSGMTADASSYLPSSHPWGYPYDWSADRVIDGAYGSDPCWHATCDFWPTPNEWVRVDLGSEQNIGKVEYYPRANTDNGSFLNYAIYVTSSSSANSQDWGTAVSTGTWSWSGGAAKKTLTFPNTAGRHVVFQCVSGVSGYASAGEVWVYKAVARTVPTPTFTVAFNSDHSQATNTASTTEGGATMYYTTNGEVPNPLNGTTVVPVMTQPGVVKARAYKTGWVRSGVATHTLTQASAVTFGPAGHAPDQFTNGPIVLTLSSQTGAVNNYKIGTTGAWSSVSQGTTVTVDGIDSGNGTIEAFAYTATTLKSVNTTSGEYSFRLPQPTSSVSYTGSAQGVLTLSSSVSGATIRYTTDGSLPTVSSTAYVSPITNSANLKVLARTYKNGYVPSGYTTAWIKKLPSAVVATTSGVLGGNLAVNNALEVWLLPNFGFTNTYAENRASSGWTASGFSFNTNGPSTNFPGSFYASATNVLLHNTRLGVSYGRQYSMSVWAAGNGGSPKTLAGQDSYDGQNLVIGAEDVGGSHGSTYLTQPLVNGATTASLANSLVFSQVSGTYYLNFFIPLTNFSRTAAVLLGNQPNTVKDILQHTVFSTGTLQVTAVNTNTHTVTLSASYPGATLPAGTVVARRNAGSTYNYSLLVNEIIPSPWTHYSNSFTALRLGAEQISPMFVYYVSSGSAGLTALEFWEGAQADRPKLHFTLDGTSNVYGQTGVAGPIKRVLNGNHEGDIRVGQRGNKYIDAAVAQRMITFSVGSVTATAQESQTSGNIDVTASTVTTGAAIYYTTDGSEPTTSSTLYTGPFTVPSYTLLKFKGFKTNYNSTSTKTRDGSLDTDSDGLPDWAEDLNGNQIVDSGETDFRNPNLRVWISRPNSASILP